MVLQDKKGCDLFFNIIDIKNLKIVYDETEHNCTQFIACAAFDKSGNNVAYAIDKKIKVIDLKHNREYVFNENAKVSQLLFLTSSTLLAVVENSISVWNIKKKNKWISLAGHRGDIVSMDINSNGLLVTSSNDNTIKFWDMNNIKEIATLVMIDDDFLIYTPEGYFAGSGDFSKYLNFIKY